MTPRISHGPIHYNLYRFGVDEVAVGKLINGDLPSDGEERWQILDAPRYHIQRLLDEHLRAQAALRDDADDVLQDLAGIAIDAQSVGLAAKADEAMIVGTRSAARPAVEQPAHAGESFVALAQQSDEAVGPGFKGVQNACRIDLRRISSR